MQQRPLNHLYMPPEFILRFETCIVPIHVNSPAVFFFPAFAGALLHFSARYRSVECCECIGRNVLHMSHLCPYKQQTKWGPTGKKNKKHCSIAQLAVKSL